MAKTKNYTKLEIKKLLEGYIEVPSELYEQIPVGAHVRYLKKGTEPAGIRFKPGSYVKNHWTNKDGTKFIQLQNRAYDIGGKGYFEFPITPNNVEKIWKKISDDFLIEYILMKREINALK